MIVVSDTTPLRHLIAIGKVDLLRTLYGAVTVPAAVWQELQAESTPARVKTWLSSAPDWLAVRSPGRPEADTSMLDDLDCGEREAILLATELHADLLLIDDREARAVALRLQLPVTGTLWVCSKELRLPVCSWTCRGCSEIWKRVVSICLHGCGRLFWSGIGAVR